MIKMSKDEMIRRVVRWFGLESKEAIKFCHMAESVSIAQLRKTYKKMMGE